VSDQVGSDPFTPEVVTAICAHMNDDHAADSLVICHAVGGRRDATAARMVGLDAHGADFVIDAGSGDTPLRIPWSHELSNRGDVRVEVVRMYQEACDALGLEPHAGAEH
jgi:putative heme iron utilization protein